MSRKNNKVYIEHMLECIEKVHSYTEGSKEKFFGSSLVQDAVIRNLQVMAESSQRVSDDLKRIHPEVAWRDISGFRNIAVHDYRKLNLDILRSILDERLDDFRDYCRCLIHMDVSCA